MALATALLQPQILLRPAPDGEAALIEDVVRLAALFGEDAAAAGPMAAAAEASVFDTGPRIEAQIASRLATAQAKLRVRLGGPRSYLDRLAADAAAADDVAGIVALLRRLLGDLKAFVDGFTLPGIRAELEFFKALIETDLGLGPAFLGDVVRAYLEALSARLEGVAPGGDAALARRRRLALAVLARLRARLAAFSPPGIDIEALARLIDRLLRQSGFAQVLREISCALDGIEASLVAAEAAGTALRPAPLPVGAGVVPLSDSAEYSWYASWLLNDEDLPLLGISDVNEPRDFVAAIQDAANPLTAHLREQFAPAERAVLDGYTDRTTDPSREVMLTALGVINRTAQRRPILEDAGGGP
ncbi:MAG TPA: hypothetical protein VFR34_01395, partial [Paracoccaceae bacterium]|nr:hypothetical protein [Paracoccaceae bacterium]